MPNERLILFIFKPIPYPPTCGAVCGVPAVTGVAALGVGADGLGVAGVAARLALVRVLAGGQPRHRVVVAGVAGGTGAVVPPRPVNNLYTRVDVLTAHLLTHTLPAPHRWTAGPSWHSSTSSWQREPR